MPEWEKRGRDVPKWNFSGKLLIQSQLILSSERERVQFWNERYWNDTRDKCPESGHNLFPYQELKEVLLLWHAACKRKGDDQISRTETGIRRKGSRSG